MVRPFKTALGGYTHIFVAVDKFTKWIEVKAVTSIESAKAAQFVEEITHCFGVRNRIITDHGKQFTGSEFWDFYQDNLIDVYYFLVAHSATTGLSDLFNSPLTLKLGGYPQVQDIYNTLCHLLVLVRHFKNQVRVEFGHDSYRNAHQG
ncbi:uncharacterized protein [Setaria viridis]|uniref:uncharacterized protein n=1 Tax=Setaria viridis TaxID=4556 RepID=UPI003B3BE2E3